MLEIQKYGQSVWLDTIGRGLITSGELQRLVDEDGLRGVTSNPNIFDKAISGGGEYDDDVAMLAGDGLPVPAIYRALAVKDIQMAADVLRGVYDSSGGDHGFVSLEVDPHLAYRTEATVEEACELWRTVDRPNVLIKVPGTRDGLPAIRRLIGEGVNVNVTLLFGLTRYGEVAEAFTAGLEERAAQGEAIDGVRSVASFFLSRIDVLVDRELEKIAARDEADRRSVLQLRGRIAVASAKQAYRIYREWVRDDRFRTLAAKGAHPQRLLWASTGTKNPDYSDVKYVEALIGPDTINTMPRKTLDAYRDHGEPRARLEEGLDESRETLARLQRAGIDIDRVTRRLIEEGVQKFIEPYDHLLETLGAKLDGL